LTEIGPYYDPPNERVNANNVLFNDVGRTFASKMNAGDEDGASAAPGLAERRAEGDHANVNNAWTAGGAA
jgi:hypothetical protein